MLRAQKHVSKLIKVLYKLTLQSIYGTKIAQNGTRNSTKQSPARPGYGCHDWLRIPLDYGFRHDYVLIPLPPDYGFHNSTNRSSGQVR